MCVPGRERDEKSLITKIALMNYFFFAAAARM
jgi:hypothetical protein